MLKFKTSLYFLLLLFVVANHRVWAIELNSTVMLFNEDDMDKCYGQLKKAQKMGNSHIAFLTSVYADLKGKKVIRYFLKNKQAQVQSVKRTNLKRYHRRLKSCIRKALKLYKNVYVTVQLNHIKDASNWRNHYDYDPLEKYQGYSLYDIAFKPFYDLPSKKVKRVYLALTGEMGKSIKLYPQSYSRILKMLPSDMNIGISINFNQSFGGFFNFNLKLPILNEVDFIGFSAYDAIPTKCKADDFKNNVESFIKKMKRYGLSKKMRFHITEMGIGGGAPSTNLISKMPYKGIYGPYSKKTDPWQNPSYVKVRSQYYQCFLDFLRHTDLIKAAFIWNANSWDFQGLYSFSEQYRDLKLSGNIKSYNESVIVK